MDTSRIFLKCVMGIVFLLGEKRHFIVFYANPKALRAKSSLHMAGKQISVSMCRLPFYSSESSLHVKFPCAGCFQPIRLNGGSPASSCCP